MKTTLLLLGFCSFVLLVERPAAAQPANCQFLGSVTISGDADIGTGCNPLVLGSGVTITIQGANRVTLGAASVQVQNNGTATLRANGSPGGKGPQGANGDGYPEPWNSRGDSDYWAARKDAEKSSKNPCRGRVGGPGQQGTRGADIFVPAGITVTGRLVLQNFGGPGGPGGDGGAGNTLRNGRQYYCDGCTYQCPSNGPGPTGPPGANGTIRVGTEVRSASGTLTIATAP